MNSQRTNTHNPVSMRTIFLVTVALLLTGCGPGPSSTKSDNAKNADAGRKAGASKATEASASGPEITEAELGVPLYPGATKVEHSNRVLNSEGKKTYVQYLVSDDDVAKVAEFYRAEAAKVGKILDTPTTSADRQVVQIALSDGRSCQVNATKSNDGKTQIHILTSDRKT